MEDIVITSPNSPSWVLRYELEENRVRFDILIEEEPPYNETVPLNSRGVIETTIGDGWLKWDGCLDIAFDKDDTYLHFCGPGAEPIMSKLFHAIWSLGEKLQHWDHDPHDPDALLKAVVAETIAAAHPGGQLPGASKLETEDWLKKHSVEIIAAARKNVDA